MRKIKSHESCPSSSPGLSCGQVTEIEISTSLQRSLESRVQSEVTISVRALSKVLFHIIRVRKERIGRERGARFG